MEEDIGGGRTDNDNTLECVTLENKRAQIISHVKGSHTRCWVAVCAHILSLSHVYVVYGGKQVQTRYYGSVIPVQTHDLGVKSLR